MPRLKVSTLSRDFRSQPFASALRRIRLRDSAVVTAWCSAVVEGGLFAGELSDGIRKCG